MEAWRSLASTLEEQRHVAAMVGRAPLHDGCVDISSNRWRAMVWPLRDVVLGPLQQNWTSGPKAKLKPTNYSTTFIMGAESLEK